MLLFVSSKGHLNFFNFDLFHQKRAKPLGYRLIDFFNGGPMKLLALLTTLSTPFLGAAMQTQIDDLKSSALESRKNAYAPYSKYYVGASLVTKSGKIFSGCNVENASFGLGNCAERTAVFKAVSEGENQIELIVVSTKDGGTPCGACRQVLNEFNPKMRVIAIDEEGHVHHDTTLDKLLPHAFGPANLD